jgi:steroid delta-isomerase-like uncharacterized protein
MTEATHETEQTVREYADIWNRQDYERIPDVVSESYVHDGPVTRVEGHAGLEGLMREFTAAFPDFHVEILNILADENTAAAEVKYTMTHEGTFNDIPSTGRRVEVGAMGKFLLREGKITEHREFHNQLEILEQLGVMDE